MSINIIDGFKVNNNNPIDKRFTAPTIDDVLNQTPEEKSYRYKSLTVFIDELQEEYWFKDGILNENFIPKTESGNSNYTGATYVKAIVDIDNNVNINLNYTEKTYFSVLNSNPYKINVIGDTDGEILVKHIYKSPIIINLNNVDYVFEGRGETLILLRYSNGELTFGTTSVNGNNDLKLDTTISRINDLSLISKTNGDLLRFTEATYDGESVSAYSIKYSITPTFEKSKWNQYNTVTNFKIDNSTVEEIIITDTATQATGTTNIKYVSIEGIPSDNIVYIGVRPLMLVDGVWILGDISNIVTYDNRTKYNNNPYELINVDENDLINYLEDTGSDKDNKVINLNGIIAKNTVFLDNGDVDTTLSLISRNAVNKFNISFDKAKRPNEQIIYFKNYNYIHKIYLCNQYNAISLYYLNDDETNWVKVGDYVGGGWQSGIYHSINCNFSTRSIKLVWEVVEITQGAYLEYVDYKNDPDGRSDLMDLVIYGNKAINGIPNNILKRKRQKDLRKNLIQQIGICNYTYVPIKLAELSLCIFKKDENDKIIVEHENQGTIRFFDQMDRRQKYNPHNYNVNDPSSYVYDLTRPHVLDYDNNRVVTSRFKWTEDTISLSDSQWGIGSDEQTPNVVGDSNYTTDTAMDELKKIGISVLFETQGANDIWGPRDHQKSYVKPGTSSVEKRLDNTWDTTYPKNGVGVEPFRPTGNGLTYREYCSDPNNYKLSSSYFTSLTTRYGNNKNVPLEHLRYTPGRVNSYIGSDGLLHVYLVKEQTKVSGLGGLSSVEINNETDSTWGRNITAGHVTYCPPQYDLAQLSAIYDGNMGTIFDETGLVYGVKNIDPEILVSTPGYAGMNIGWMRYMFLLNKTIRSDGKLPFDIFNQHHYSTMNGLGQYGEGGGPADIDPLVKTTDGTMSKTETHIDIRDRNNPNVQYWITEFGYDETRPDGTTLAGRDIIGKITNGRNTPDKDKSRTKGEWIVRSTIKHLSLGTDNLTLYTLAHDFPFHTTTFDFYMWDELMDSYSKPGDIYNITKQYAGNDGGIFRSCGLFGSLYDAHYPPSRAFWYWSCFKNTCGDYKFEGLINDPTDPLINIASFSKSGTTKGLYVVWYGTADNSIYTDYKLNVNNSTYCNKTEVYVPKMPNAFKVPESQVNNPPSEFYPLVVAVNQPYTQPDTTVKYYPGGDNAWTFDYQNNVIPQVNALYDFMTGTTEGNKGLLGVKSNQQIINNEIIIDITESPTYYEVDDFIPLYSLKKPDGLVIENGHNNNKLWFNNYSYEYTYEIYVANTLSDDFIFYNNLTFNFGDDYNTYNIPLELNNKYIKIKAKKGESLSQASDIIYVPSLNPLGKITGLTYNNITNMSVSLNWDYISGETIDYVDIYRGHKIDQLYFIKRVYGNKYNDFSLFENTKYYYAIRTNYNDNYSELSNIVNFTTDYNNNYTLTVASALINNGDNEISYQTLDIELYPQNYADYYRISETNDFTNVQWINYTGSTIQYVLKNLETRNDSIYIQFRDFNKNIIGDIYQSETLNIDIYDKRYITFFRGYEQNNVFNTVDGYNTVAYSWEHNDFLTRDIYDIRFKNKLTYKCLDYDIHAGNTGIGWKDIPYVYETGTTVVVGDINNTIDLSGFTFTFNTGTTDIHGIMLSGTTAIVNGNIYDMYGIEIDISNNIIKYRYPFTWVNPTDQNDTIVNYLYKDGVGRNGVETLNTTPTRFEFSNLRSGYYKVYITAPTDNSDETNKKAYYQANNVNGSLFTYKNPKPLILSNVYVGLDKKLTISMLPQTVYDVVTVSVIEFKDMKIGKPTFDIITDKIANFRSINVGVESDFYISDISISETPNTNNFIGYKSENNYIFNSNTSGQKTLYIKTKCNDFISDEKSITITYNPISLNFITTYNWGMNTTLTDYNGSIVNAVATVSKNSTTKEFKNNILDTKGSYEIPMTITISSGIGWQDVAAYDNRQAFGLFKYETYWGLFSSYERGRITINYDQLWETSYKVKLYGNFLEDVYIIASVNGGQNYTLSTKNNIVNYICINDVVPVNGRITILFSETEIIQTLAGIVEIEGPNQPLELISVSIGDGFGTVNKTSNINARCYGSPTQISISFNQLTSNWQPFIEGVPISFNFSESYNKIYVKVKDVLGNVSNTKEINYTLKIYNPFMEETYDTYFTSTNNKSTLSKDILNINIPNALAYRYSLNNDIITDSLYQIL